MTDDELAEEGGGEGYFASVSDLMVGVLFVFLLMLTVLALNFRDDSARLDQLIAQVAQAKQAAQKAQAEAERLRAQNEALRLRLEEAADALRRELAGREAARASLLRRLAQGLESRGIRFILDQQSGVLRLSDAVPFALGKSDLTDTARHTVTALAEVLDETLPCFAYGQERHGCEEGDAPVLEAVLVEGHTDRQGYPNMTPAQSQAQNDLLSTSRALTVFGELRRLKPALEALHNPEAQPLLGVSGYGERRPLPNALTLAETDLAQNRRIDLRFILSAPTSGDMRRLLDDIASLQAANRP
jgi:flagellar motor protein MotB